MPYVKTIDAKWQVIHQLRETCCALYYSAVLSYRVAVIRLSLGKLLVNLLLVVKRTNTPPIP